MKNSGVCCCIVRRTTCLLTSLVLLVNSDIYLHNPRGSNNRLKESSAQRANDKRVFDSQNNGRGGYNVGDRTKVRASTESQQYQMVYFQSSSKMGDGSRIGASLLDIEIKSKDHFFSVT